MIMLIHFIDLNTGITMKCRLVMFVFLLGKWSSNRRSIPKAYVFEDMRMHNSVVKFTLRFTTLK
jgi:hypothetical protein